MSERGVVVGIYQQRDTAHAVLSKLRKKRFRRSASIRQAQNGKQHHHNYRLAPSLLASFGGGAGFLLALAALFALRVPAFSPRFFLTLAIVIFIGAIGGGLLSRVLNLGVSAATLARYRRWILPNEILVIVEADVSQLRAALDILRQVETGAPITFVFYPERPYLGTANEPVFREPLTSERMIAQVRALAASQPVTKRLKRGRPLLHSLRLNERAFKLIRQHLTEASRLEQGISLSAEWLLDNARIIQGHIDDFRRNLPRAYYEQLPVLSSGSLTGLPRIYALAGALIEDTDARLDESAIHDFLQSYQSVTPLTIGELWAFPLLLRLRLIERLQVLAAQVDRRQIEREQADFWANRLLNAVRKEPDHLLAFVTELAREQPNPSAHLADQLASHLYDEDMALSPVRGWLERKLNAPLQEITQQEQRVIMRQQISLSNAINSLRMLTQLDWRDQFEAQSRVDAILWTDPAGVYAQMDFATRDRCRHAIEEISRRSQASEIDVTLKVLEMANQADDALRGHVGYYLIDAGREDLERQAGAKPLLGTRLRRRVYRHPALVYLGSIGALTLALAAVFIALAWQMETSIFLIVLLGLLALLPLSELAVQIINYFVTRLLPPRVLPKMRFEQGLPDDFRSIVVVPMMLLTPGSIRDEVERLEIRYLANADPNLRYALLSDYSDANQQYMPEDMERLEVAVRGIEDLNAKYGEGRFFLFHRDRVWSASEQRWMGWERKRGKLENLNSFLMGESGPELDNFLRVGEAGRLQGIRFVITLDADTQLPHDAARRMVETFAHPLNQPQIAPDGSHVLRGYTILQPRVSTSLPSATASIFSRLFTDPTGTDPYTHAISDVYQDLAGEGSYHGKGIYDLRAFYQMLHGRFPESHLLSHDLIEGAHVRVGLVSDIELFDLFPRDYLVYSGRQHRWTRGDWQILDWIFPRVPAGKSVERLALSVEEKNASTLNTQHSTLNTQRLIPNPLSVLNRWKIFDNLRRSLLPAAYVLLLGCAWLLSPPSAPLWSLLVGSILLFPAFSQLLTRLTTKWQYDPQAWRDVGVSLLRVFVFAALLPHQALLSLDAIGRVLYRRFVSHKLLLEWETAQEAHQKSRNRQTQFLWHMAWIPVVSLGLLLTLSHWHRLALNAGNADAAFTYFQDESAAMPFLLVWMLSLLIVAWLSTRVQKQPALALASADRKMLRGIARQTWRFFDDFVGPQTNWLPPDNYQAFLNVEVAPRTSPTNIGLWLLALLSARDFGYLTPDDVIERTHATLQTLSKLEKYEGHLLNWYDIENCQPLPPRYVSMVDSGNLLGDLWALEQGHRELLDLPVLNMTALRGIQDALDVLRLTPKSEKTQDVLPERLLTALESLFIDNAIPEMIVRAFRQGTAPARELVETLQNNKAATDTHTYWAGQIEKQISNWNETMDRYLSWMEVLAKPPEGLLALGPEAHEWRRQALKTVPSLRTLAGGHVPGLENLIAFRGRGGIPPALNVWLDTLEASVSRAQWLAGERLAQAEEGMKQTRELADGMNMKFLYHPERKVFAIGYNVNDHRLDNSYYDLLASEARLGSFAAIARGDVPVEHWFALGRPFATAYKERVLLSWSGTMFEYLMPLLLTRAYENSLLDQACTAAVEAQIAYGKQRGIPWGISEAAYSALDARQTYQYRAFGVPGLGLKRGLEEDLVVAPYASALALAVAPVSAVRNLKKLSRLSRMGLRAGYGYYESIDYTRQQGPQGERGVPVYCYMAHHQGMSLLAIDNVLNNNIMQARFHADPRVKATESLLYERVPVAPPLNKEYVREAPVTRLKSISTGIGTGRTETADTPTPRTHLLSNGAYSVMITNSGSGYSKWRDFELTRWRADTTRDNLGQFCYCKDLESGAVWSATDQPTASRPSSYSVLFAQEKAEIRRRDSGIEIVTEIIVSPEDDAEIRRITLVNHSLRERHLELTSYAELAMFPHNADRAHPAFSKLFVQTEAVPKNRALLAWRRPRSPEDPKIWAAHILSLEGEDNSPLQFETDRGIFIGRGRSLARPAGVDKALLQTQGAVLDPIFSLREQIALHPGERRQFAFVTAAGETREAVVALTEKYSDFRAADRAFEIAWTRAQLELRHLRIQPEEAQQFQQLAGLVLYPQPTLRANADRLKRNTLPQSGLWAHGISGDLPIVVATIADPHDVDLIRQVLMAHEFWRAHGLKADLVILNEEASSYDQPLQEQLKRMIQTYSQTTGMDQPGGVFLRPAAQIPDTDLTLILTVARVVLIAARGPLSQQLGTQLPSVPIPPAITKNTKIAEELSPPLPFMDLPYFNGLGGFTQDGKEYAIYLEPGAQTPAPWINVIANPNFGTLASESHVGFSWYGNSQSNRLTPWSNDPVTDPTGDCLYIRDEELGTFWTPTAGPIREQDAYRARHGQGYTVYEHNSHAIGQELTVFVPVEGNDGGDPVRIQILKLRNYSSRRRKLTVTLFNEWTLGVDREDTQMHVVTNWDAETQSLFARNAYHPDFGSRVAFAACSPPPTSYCADRTLFLGRNKSPVAPDAMNRKKLMDRAGAGLDPCAALQTGVEIEPGQETTLIFLLGEAGNVGEARGLIQKYRDPIRAGQTLKAARDWWDNMLGAVQVETPDLAVNFLLNRWLLYQDLSCRVWGRSAFYQSGGAYGFRDQLQDVLALVYADPQATRDQIVRSAARQFVEGDVQHWWHPPSGTGVRTRISDDLLWLPFVTAHYVRVTGDKTVLDHSAPFLEGKVLEPNEHEMMFVPTVSQQSAPILEHCRRAIEKGFTSGPHGLPLIGGGDWNDGLNRVGIEGKGESVWMAWFLIHVLNDFAYLLEQHGDGGADEYRQKAKKLAQTVEEQAWDGKWYRRAYFDDGTPLGSAQNEEAKIDSLGQSWAVISGAGNPEHIETALQSVQEHLVREQEKMVLLFTPPFDKTPHDPGYIKGYLPGVRENGGQYTHGSLWVPLAFARKGDGDTAVKLLKLMHPVEHTRIPEDVQRYKVEPYVVVADVYALEEQVGRGGWTWYTGSAGWMYRVWLEEVLGFRREGNLLRINPTLPKGWTGFGLRYRFGKTMYDIQIDNSAHVSRGIVAMEFDGTPLSTFAIPLKDDGTEHRIKISMGEKAESRE